MSKCHPCPQYPGAVMAFSIITFHLKIPQVFGETTMTHYLMLFNALWRAKRIEWLLSGVWKNLASMHKLQSRMVPELFPLLHIANLLASEMIHFIHQLAYYITFEVMECSWDILIKQLRQAESLDQVCYLNEAIIINVHMILL